MTSLTFSKAVQQVGLESLLGRFCPLGLMFDSPDQNHLKLLTPYLKSLTFYIFVFFSTLEMCLIHLKKHLIISNHNFTIILKEHFMFLIQNQIIITNYNYFLNIPMTGSINVVFFFISGTCSDSKQL